MNPCRIETVHALSGRIRIRVKGLKGNPYFARSLEKTFKRKNNIFSVKANSQTGKALIIFNPSKISIDELQAELSLAIAQIFRIVAPVQLKKYRDEKLQLTNKKTSNKIFEPEDLPISTQVAYVLGAGLVIILLILARLFKGRLFWTGSPKLHWLAGLTSVLTGYPIFRSGIESLIKAKKLNNDLLISTATIVSLALKESITGLVVVWLVNLSSLFQTLTLDRSRKAIKKMLQGKEEMAWVEIDGAIISIPVESLKVGNTVVCNLGDKIPVDGQIIDGTGAISQAVITGESMPITKEVGEKVFAGSIVEQGTIKIRAEQVGADTSLARIIHMVEEASETKAPIQNIADKYSEKIVPISFGLAALIFLLTRDFKRSMTMLIVACPCAAGLATPTALSAAMGNAAANGILIKGGSYLEKVGETDIVLFDKTGTLTEGKPTVAQVISLSKRYLEEHIVQIAATVEAQTNHPLAKAIVNKAEELRVSLLTVENKETMVGQGVKAIVEAEEIIIGNQQMMEDHNVNLYRGKAKAAKLNLLGQTALFLAKNRILIGIIGITDKIRAESKHAITELRHSGIDTIGLITGDTRETAEIVGGELGVDRIWASTLPEGKVDIVKAYQGQEKIVTMVGEGVNDSPALAIADVGIAMGAGGTDVAIESADVVLAGDNPNKIPALIRLSNDTMEIIRQNFIFAVGINAIGLFLGAGKLISPLLAAILHNLSTFGVVVNSTRLLNYQLADKKGRKKFVRAKRVGR
ncbi:MAG: heavy metal translocating P-type ATPase [Bacillota bacterium]|nr:heavy metal translocating P-type ATPase [Bacillota bacterium]